MAELEAADDKLQVKTRVLRSGAGAITNEDIMLASVNSASTTIIGFNSVASAQQEGEDLLWKDDRVMVIDSTGVCGVSEPTASSSGPLTTTKKSAAKLCSGWLQALS